MIVRGQFANYDTVLQLNTLNSANANIQHVDSIIEFNTLTKVFAINFPCEAMKYPSNTYEATYYYEDGSSAPVEYGGSYMDIQIDNPNFEKELLVKASPKIITTPHSLHPISPPQTPSGFDMTMSYLCSACGIIFSVILRTDPLG